MQKLLYFITAIYFGPYLVPFFGQTRLIPVRLLQVSKYGPILVLNPDGYKSTRNVEERGLRRLSSCGSC
jgi:hypothetical protein